MSIEIPVPVIEEAQSGDQLAMAQVVDGSVAQVYGWCMRLGGPRVDAEDAAHDVFIVVVTGLHKLREPACYPAWLFGVTRRVIKKHRSRAWIRRWFGEPRQDVADPALSPASTVASAETADQVWALLDELPHKQREVVVLADLEEHSLPEIARLLDVPVGTVKSRLRLGRERFRKGARRRDLEPMAEWAGGSA